MDDTQQSFLDRDLTTLLVGSLVLDREWAEDKSKTRSMAAMGQVEPIHVYPDPESDILYIVVDGRRRTVSARVLGWKTLEAFVYKSEADALFAVALAANLHSPNKLSDALNLLASGMSAEDAYKIAGINKTQYEHLKELTTLRADYKDDLAEGKLCLSSARRLARFSKKKQQEAMTLARKRNAEAEKPRKYPTSRDIDWALREHRYNEQREQMQQMALDVPTAFTSNGGERSAFNAMGAIGVLTRLREVYPDAEAIDAIIAWCETQ